jgi:hypothetical protein
MFSVDSVHIQLILALEITIHPLSNHANRIANVKSTEKSPENPVC